MTTINPFYSGQNYSLATQLDTGTSQDKTASSVTKLPALTSSLLASAETNVASEDAYQINLSPEAKAYLAKLEEKKAASSSETDGGFALTKQQAEQIKEIVSKYIDAPLTQETFDKIQADLRAAGLGAEQLAIKDQIASFNPTSSLIAALDGTAGEVVVQKPAEILAQQEAKGKTYMEQVERLWRALAAAEETTAG